MQEGVCPHTTDEVDDLLVEWKNSARVTKAQFETWILESTKRKLDDKHWNALDTNKDGILEWHEFDGPKGKGTEE